MKGLIAALRRYGQVWGAQMRYSLTRELMFKGNFLIWVGVEVIWFVLQIAFINVVYDHTDSVAGWTKYEMILLAGTSQLVAQLFQAFFMTNLLQLPELVRTGKLDFFLAQPAAAQFLISTRLFDPGAVINGGLSVGVCVYALWHLSHVPSVWGVVGFSVWVGCGVMFHYSLMLALVTLSFWIVRSEGIVHGYWNFLNLARLPRDAFRGIARIVFTYVFPLLLVANVPAETLLGRGGLGWGLLFAALCAALVAGSSALFQCGLRRYSSASS